MRAVSILLCILLACFVISRLHNMYLEVKAFLEMNPWGIGVVEVVRSLVVAFVITIVVGGLLWGCMIALAHFIGSLRILKQRDVQFESFGSKEPSCNGYFYWRGDWIVNNIALCRYNFVSDGRAIAYYVSCIPDTWNRCSGIWMTTLVFVPVFIFQLFRIVTAVVAMLILSPLLFVPFCMLGVVMFVVEFTLSLVLCMMEFIIMAIRQIFVLCPTCSRRVARPMYRCPRCGRIHKVLRPSPRYGALMHRCVCGELLPTTRFMGRHKLQALCPHEGCGAELGHHTEEVHPVTLALIGGTSAGKSMLQAAMIHFLLQNKGKGVHLSRNEDDIRKLLNNWKNGTIPGTRLEALNANGLDIKRNGISANRRLYFYDSAGEAFTHSRHLSSHRHYNYLACSVMVVDPFSMPEVQRKLKRAAKSVPSEVRASTHSADDVFNRWMLTMETSGNIRKTYCAVVITKMDRPEIQSVAGFASGASNEICRAFLEHNGLASVVAMASGFKEVRYFALSGLSSPHSSQTFDPGLEQMMRWIEEKCL